METANKMRIPLKVCGSHLQFADTDCSCGFRNSSIYRYKRPIICLWIPPTVLHSANTVADSAISLIFGAILIGTIF